MKPNKIFKTWILDKKFLLGTVIGILLASFILIFVLGLYRVSLTGQKRMMVSVKEIFPPKIPASATSSFILNFKGKNIQLTIDSQTYWSYKSESHKSTHYPSYCDTTGLRTISNIIKDNCSDTTSQLELAQTLLEFVHCLPYIQEIDNYTKYPLETLVEGGGDCKDLSVLYASLGKVLGLDIIFKRYRIQPAGHVNCAVALGEEIPKGSKVKFQRKFYYTAETTDPKWKIGDEPPNLRNYIPFLVKL